MRKHTLFALAAVVALALPVAASAEDGDVRGPATLHSHGWFGGNLETAAPDDTRPIRFAIARGRIGILDLGGDARVKCGDHTAETHETDRGKVYSCRGHVLEVAVVGRHILFRGVGARVVLMLPEGTGGTLHGFRADAGRLPSSERERREDRKTRETRPRPDHARSVAHSHEGDAGSRETP